MFDFLKKLTGKKKPEEEKTSSEEQQIAEKEKESFQAVAETQSEKTEIECTIVEEKLEAEIEEHTSAEVIAKIRSGELDVCKPKIKEGSVSEKVEKKPVDEDSTTIEEEEKSSIVPKTFGEIVENDALLAEILETSSQEVAKRLQKGDLDQCWINQDPEINIEGDLEAHLEEVVKEKIQAHPSKEIRCRLNEKAFLDELLEHSSAEVIAKLRQGALDTCDVPGVEEDAPATLVEEVEPEVKVDYEKDEIIKENDFQSILAEDALLQEILEHSADEVVANLRKGKLDKCNIKKNTKSVVQGDLDGCIEEVVREKIEAHPSDILKERFNEEAFLLDVLQHSSAEVVRKLRKGDFDKKKEAKPADKDVKQQKNTETSVMEETSSEQRIAEEPKEQPVKDPDRKQGWFGLDLGTFKKKLSKTSDALIGNVVAIASGKEILDDDAIDEIEERLIKADIGLETACEICDTIRVNKHKITPDKLKDYLHDQFSGILLAGKKDFSLNYRKGKLNVYLITGVNGVGKTTLIGKLAYRFKEQGNKVLVAAGDTFRAAAEEQLNIWSERAGADIVRKDGADPSAVIYDAIQKAKKEKYDVLLIDTAGRLHNKFNLMAELGKIKKTIDKNAKEELAESILVLDATTGQNGLQQAKVFSEAVNLTSVALTKLDGSAKGGIILAISSALKIPVKLVGVGEKIDDLRDFDPKIFIDAIF